MGNFNREKFFFFTDKKESEVFVYPMTLEHAYLNILEDNLAAAEKVFSELDSPRSRWGGVLVSVLRGYLEIYPTFFQIRNFLEIDLDFLLKNEKLDYVENLLGALDFFSTINQESYKFAARVMFEDKFYSAAFNYMQKSKMIYYNDAELHFMLARYYEKVHDYNSALYEIEECLKLIPEYYPALKFKKSIEETLF